MARHCTCLTTSTDKISFLTAQTFLPKPNGAADDLFDIRDGDEAAHPLRRERVRVHAPQLRVVGDKEVESGTVAVRTRGGEDLGTMTFEDFCDHLNQDIARFGRTE
mgnify:CR=1 FL=1